MKNAFRAALALALLATTPVAAAARVSFHVGATVVSSMTVQASAASVGSDGIHLRLGGRGSPARVLLGAVTLQAPASGDLRLAAPAHGDVVVTLLY